MLFIKMPLIFIFLINKLVKKNFFFSLSLNFINSIEKLDVPITKFLALKIIPSWSSSFPSAYLALLYNFKILLMAVFSFPFTTTYILVKLNISIIV